MSSSNPGKIAIYIWSDGKAAYVGRSAFPRERRGQHRSSALRGSRTAFHAYLREVGIDSGEWKTQWVPAEKAAHLEARWIEAVMRTGARSLNVEHGSAKPARATAWDETNWRAGLAACRKETAYLADFLRPC